MNVRIQFYGVTAHDDSSSCRDLYLQAAWPTHGLTLQDEDRRGRVNQLRIPQISTERGRSGTGCRVFNDTPDRKWIARVKETWSRAPHELNSREVRLKH